MRRKGPIQNHGTPASYKNHKWRGEAACAECREAWTDYYRKYREQRDLNGTTPNQ